ncbi:MAG: hypothetical protein RTU92_01660 [Candidatus Thorarchaeota archaeon]
MSKKEVIRELFIIDIGGIPISHVGTGQLQVDDALLGGLLSALSDVGLTLGLSDAGTLEAITFQGFDLVYARTEHVLVVLLSSQESSEFYQKCRVELIEIGNELESKGLLDEPSFRTAQKLRDIAEVISHHARTVFAKQHDVFIWDENHSFRLVESTNARWSGLNLFRNYLMLSPLSESLAIPTSDLNRICDILMEMKRPSEIMNDPELTIKDPKLIEDSLRFMHKYGIVDCYQTTIVS